MDKISLKENRDFLRMYRHGRYYVGKYIVVYVAANKLSMLRIGITVSKKVGKAVTRNRVRRLIRECFNQYMGCLNSNYDFVIVARHNDVIPDYHSIKKELRFLLKKLGVLDVDKWAEQK